MAFEFYFLFAMILLLAWANGANDIAKGVATLVGNGTAQARRAVWWGTLWTVAGGLLAILWGGALIKTFSSGYLSTGFQVDFVFLISAILGAVAWLLVATRFGLPVSTTHALLGGVVGAALVAAGPQGLQLDAVTNKAMLPLLLAPLLAIALCATILLLARYVASRLPAWKQDCCDYEDWQRNPFVCLPPAKQNSRTQRMEKLWLSLHWLSSGLTSFARGLNDVPKIAAFLILSLALVPEIAGKLTAPENHYLPILLITFVMGIGCLWGGMRVLHVMSHRVTTLDSSSGLVANAGTSMLVLFASPLGIPVSTTHVSTGSIMGIRWANKLKPSQADALKLILFGWVVTLPVAASVAAISSSLLTP